MDNFKYVNAGESTLSAGITAGSVQLTVANAGRFPSSLGVGESLVLTLHPSGLPSTQEIVICTAIASGVMTVTRGAQGTTAQDWPSGTVVGAYLTAEMLRQIRDKVMPISGTNTGDETAARIGTIVSGAAAKTTPVDADLLGLSDSAASNVLKKFSWAALKAALKTYFDTLYNKYVHPNHSGDVTSVADGAQTIAANAVTNSKLADMANGAIKGRVTSGAGDPEDLTATQVRTILNVADGSQKNSDITKPEIEAKLTGTNLTSHGHSEEIATALAVAGKVLQKVVSTSTSTFAITAQIPADASIPQDTEGTEFFSTSFTPKKSGSTIFVTLSFWGIGDNADCAAALFQSGSASAFSTRRVYGIYGWNAVVAGVFTASGTSPVTISARGGVNGTSRTMYVNRSEGANMYSTSSVITMTIEEIAA